MGRPAGADVPAKINCSLSAAGPAVGLGRGSQTPTAGPRINAPEAAAQIRFRLVVGTASRRQGSPGGSGKQENMKNRLI